ncbi:hypothetical protein T07_9065 [Trichinella nelsoni]|uniref:Uncharacterized protein n=1 Tax=Trichinella nelsoni TaxID=6336 RepID=A0A0V0RX47_9BILA|nr:hypothetical protein T07_9065 [Trichinella nelsoni]
MATEARRSIDYWGQYNWTRPSNRIGRLMNRRTVQLANWWGVAWSDCVSTSKFDRLHWQA